MKKLLALLLSLSMVFVLSGCGNQKPDEETINYKVVYTDIQVNDDGYYGLMGPVELTYYKGDLTNIYINDPALLYFAVSSQFNGGVYILDLTEGKALISELTVISEELMESGNMTLAEKINQTIEQLQNCGPITGAST